MLKIKFKGENTMKKMTIYEVYLEDADNCYKLTIPATSENEALAYVEGNGEVITIKKAKNQKINIDYISDVLKKSEVNQTEIDIISRCLIQCGLC
jgi:hypothetical protein